MECLFLGAVGASVIYEVAHPTVALGLHGRREVGVEEDLPQRDAFGRSDLGACSVEAVKACAKPAARLGVVGAADAPKEPQSALGGDHLFGVDATRADGEIGPAFVDVLDLDSARVVLVGSPGEVGVGVQRVVWGVALPVEDPRERTLVPANRARRVVAPHDVPDIVELT
jgi:hypothetical protein